jgi:hypothetical protein
MTRLLLLLMGLLALAFVAAPTAPAQAVEMTGTVVAVDPAKDQFTMFDGEQNSWTVLLVPGAQVFRNDKKAKLAEVQAGDRATIIYEQQDFERLLTSEVRARSPD